MLKTDWKSRTKRDLIIEVWEFLDCESVGAAELQQIHQALRARFGEGATESPAAIARIVADEGAVLRHPEVFECDRKWREENLARSAFADQLDFSSLSSAFTSVVKLEEKRMELQADSAAEALKSLRDGVTAISKDLSLNARSRIIDDAEKAQLKEVSNWLTVWLQSPELFSDWLDLRRRSPEFRKKFGE
ncbi:MAG TPA: hypothetical protein VIW64_12430 [Pyrinomonadaceae bacterium]